jgi:3-hydroxyisobutyrate dehydrogenase-like beta-hydroxyacid dehydrogenase
MTQLGFVGLGTLGSRAAKRLLDAGYQVTGYNHVLARLAGVSK